MLAPRKQSYDKPRQHFKKQRYHFADKCPYSQSYGSSSSHVQMWELNHKEDQEPKNWCCRIVVLKKILESPLNCKEIQPVIPKGNLPWIFIRKTDAQAPIFWPPGAKSWLIGRPLMLRKIKDNRGQLRIRWLDSITDPMDMNLSKLDDTEGQGSLTCCSPWGCRVRHKLVTEQQQQIIIIK